MKRIEDVIKALDAKIYDEDTVKDAVMYLELFQGLMHETGQIYEYYYFWNRETEEDEPEDVEGIQCRLCKSYEVKTNSCVFNGADVGNPYDEHDCIYYEYDENWKEKRDNDR